MNHPGVIKVSQRSSICGGEQLKRQEGMCLLQDREEGLDGTIAALRINLVACNVDFEGYEVT